MPAKTHPSAQSYITPEGFAEREGLTRAEFLALLGAGLRNLPEIISIAGDLRISGAPWKRPTGVGLKTWPGAAGNGDLLDAETFCATYALSFSGLLRLALRFDLPAVFRAPNDRGGVVISASDARLWALARRAEAAGG